MQIKKLLTIILAVIVLATLVSAALGTYKLNDCVQIKTILNATTVNISSISYPNSSIAISNQVMTKNAQTFNYTFCNTAQLGTYVYDYFDNGGNVYVNSFTISANGLETTSAQGTVYMAMLLLLVGVFIFLSIMFTRIPFENGKNDDGILYINWKKYLKIGIFMAAYVSFIGIMYFAWNLSYGILQFTEMANFFQVMFRISYMAMFPLLIVIIIFSVARFAKDKKLEKMSLRGLTIR